MCRRDQWLLSIGSPLKAKIDLDWRGASLAVTMFAAFIASTIASPCYFYSAQCDG